MTDDFDPEALELPAEVVREAKLQVHPAQYQAHVDIARLINTLRQATPLSDYRELQQRLGQHIARVEAEVGHANERLSHLDRRLRRRRRRMMPTTPAEFADIEAEQEQAFLDRMLYLRLARQYRMVGDAMAWQLYDFQTQVISALGMNASPGIIGPKAGATGEAEQVDHYWQDKGAFALRHDYTNCLRIGDLTVFYPDKPDSVELVEVKSGRAEASSKQKHRAKMASEFVRDQMTTADDGVLLIHRRQGSQSSNEAAQGNFPLIARAVMEASSGSGFGMAHNTYLAVKAINMFHPDVRHPDQAMRDKVSRILETPEAIMVLPCQDYLRADSHQKLLAPLFGAPFSIYLFPPDAVAALITGYLRLVIHLNICAVVEAFKMIGFEALFIPAQQNMEGMESFAADNDQFLVRRGDFTIRLGPNVIEQMLFEGLPVEDIVESIRVEFENFRHRRHIIIPRIVGPYPRKTNVLTTFLGLESIWRASREMTLDDDKLPKPATTTTNKED